jgi:hypothetical protein
VTSLPLFGLPSRKEALARGTDAMKCARPGAVVGYGAPGRTSSSPAQRPAEGTTGGEGPWPACGSIGDSGGASRFFYTAKASSGERHYAGRNGHPTVKPVDLMRWLCRLVTPPGGLILDPFCGSGSTGVAALAEGFRFLGCQPVRP